MKKAPSLLSDGLALTGFAAVVVTVLLGLFSFTLSYFAMRELARSSGAVVNGLDLIWPLTVDFAMIVFGLVALFKTMRAQSAKAQRALVLLFSALSVLFNVLHSPALWSSRLVAAMPPFALVLALESLIEMITSTIKAGTEQRDSQWRGMIAEQNQIIEALKNKVAERAVEEKSVPAKSITCFCDSSLPCGNHSLHVFQVRQQKTAQAGLDALRQIYPNSDGRLPDLATVEDWQRG